MRAKVDETNIKTQRTFYKLWKNIETLLQKPDKEIIKSTLQLELGSGGTNEFLIASRKMEIFFFNVCKFKYIEN